MSSPTVELAAVGDIMLGRYVGRRIERDGPDKVFAGVAASLKTADLAFGNLECVLSERPFVGNKRFELRGHARSVEALKSAGFDALSIANNHALDCGLDGRSDTERALFSARITPVGGSNYSAILEAKGIRIGFLAFSDFPPPAMDGVLGDQIRAVHSQCDVLVVSWHWGLELSQEVSPRQRALAEMAARAGADAVIGHHPHVLQPIEWLELGRRRCLVAYSLGNFVFDAKPGPERTSIVLHLALGEDGVQAYRLENVQIEGGFPVSRGYPEG